MYIIYIYIMYNMNMHEYAISTWNHPASFQDVDLL